MPGAGAPYGRSHPEPSTWEGSDESSEIASFYLEELLPGDIQYNILPKGDQPWVRGIGINCSESEIEALTERLRAEWIEPRSTSLLLLDTIPAATGDVPSASTYPSVGSVRVRDDADWVHRPNEILQRLESDSTTEEDRHAAVLFAETTPFDGAMRGRLVNALCTYIDQNRLSDDPDRMVYLCSAIRKYAMNMGQSEFDSYADWLSPTETTAVHHMVEMEFIKGLSYRLQFAELSRPATSSAAIECLSEIATGYLRKSLILRKSYANTAMLAIVCIAILESLSDAESTQTKDLLDRVRSLKIAWFQEMVEHSLSDALRFVRKNNPEVAVKLRELIDVS